MASILFISVSCAMFYLYLNNSPNYLYLSVSDFNISDSKYKDFNISDEKEMTDITSQKEFQIYLKDNIYKVRFKFTTNESLKDKYIRIHFSTMGTNENWKRNYNCSNLGESITIEDGYIHPVAPILKLDESELSGWYKIINTDLNYTGGYEYCIEFNINTIDFGQNNLFIELFRARGHKTTITVNASRFESIFYDDAKMNYFYPDSLNFIFNERNKSSTSTIYLKNRYGDFFLFTAIFSLAGGIGLSIGSMLLTLLESNDTKNELKKTKKGLNKIERKMSKREDIKEIKEKLENIENRISDINIPNNKKN